MSSSTTNEPTLTRTITLWPLVLFGIAYITPFIVLTTFGVFSEASNGTLASAYLLSTVAMIFTALSYAKLAGIYPQAGSAYTYSRKAIGPRTGFVVGWAVLLDYFFLPMVVWLIGTAYLTDQFPNVPGYVFLLAFIILTTVLNVIGIAVATRVTLALITFQVLVLAFFVGLSILRILNDGDPSTAFTIEPFWNSTTTITAISAGAALTAYSFIGFDAVSTFAEETVDPTRTVPKAIILTAAIGGTIFAAVAYIVQLVSPGGVFENPDSAALDIARTIGGDLFAAIFLATVIVAQFTAGIPIQAAGARLMYAMGRDGVLPKRYFGYISPRFHSPMLNLLLTGAIGLMALALSVSTSTSFINFGAFTAFAFVNISVIFQFFRDRDTTDRNPVTWLVIPFLGLAVIAWLLSNLDINAITIGFIWVGIGVAWLAYLTKGFKVATPDMDFNEDVQIETPNAQKG